MDLTGGRVKAGKGGITSREGAGTDGEKSGRTTVAHHKGHLFE